MIEFAPDEPRWRQVARIIRQRIEDGVYQPGTRVPSVTEMLDEFGISTSTGQKVHRGLRAEGLIYTESGMGSFVSKDFQKKQTAADSGES
ncbi:GntR family transcriptional regulator [Streptomyces chrestomyceticus]|uniref:GntR family transcriptional regulator n=1 Tax=Streptomyces chrestomyceticus TaxID=68185 RepID=UPI0033FE33EE